MPGQINSYHVRIRHASLGQVKVRSGLVRCRTKSGQIRSVQVRSGRDSSGIVRSYQFKVTESDLTRAARRMPTQPDRASGRGEAPRNHYIATADCARGARGVVNPTDATIGRHQEGKEKWRTSPIRSCHIR